MTAGTSMTNILRDATFRRYDGACALGRPRSGAQTPLSRGLATLKRKGL